MEKTKFTYLIIFGLLMFACKNEGGSKNGNQLSVKSEFEKKTQENQQQSVDDSFCEKITGSWRYVENDKTTAYRLKFEKKSDKIIGTHCFIRGEMGEEMDCPDANSFSGHCDNDKLIGEFKSDWEKKPIKCEIRLVGDTLILKALSNVGMSYFLPEMKFKKKK